MNQVVARIAMPVLGIVGALCGALAAVACVLWILDQRPGSPELWAMLGLGLAAAGCFFLRRLLFVAARRSVPVRAGGRGPG